MLIIIGYFIYRISRAARRTCKSPSAQRPHADPEMRGVQQLISGFWCDRTHTDIRTQHPPWIYVLIEDLFSLSVSNDVFAYSCITE